MKNLNENGYIIRISENALIQMCLNGLEAYLIKHRVGARKSSKLETFGLLWGNEITLPNRKTLYSVDMLSIDTSAEMGKATCDPKDEALELKRDLMTSFWPQYDFIGDFHTHPWNHYSEVVKDKLYEFSETDYESIEERPEFWEKHNYRVGLVLTVSTMERISNKDPEWIDNCTLEFTFRNYRMYLRGCVTWSSGNGIEVSRNDDNVILDCPALIGLVGEYSDFGKHSGSRSRGKHRIGTI